MPQSIQAHRLEVAERGNRIMDARRAQASGGPGRRAMAARPGRSFGMRRGAPPGGRPGPCGAPPGLFGGVGG